MDFGNSSHLPHIQAGAGVEAASAEAHPPRRAGPTPPPSRLLLGSGEGAPLRGVLLSPPAPTSHEHWVEAVCHSVPATPLLNIDPCWGQAGDERNWVSVSSIHRTIRLSTLPRRSCQYNSCEVSPWPSSAWNCLLKAPSEEKGPGPRKEHKRATSTGSDTPCWDSGPASTSSDLEQAPTQDTAPRWASVSTSVGWGH